MNTIKQLRSLRKSLPQGKKDPWGDCCNSKRVLLQRALKKKSLEELTDGERAIVKEYTEYAEQLKRERDHEINQLAEAVNKLVQ